VLACIRQLNDLFPGRVAGFPLATVKDSSEAITCRAKSCLPKERFDFLETYSCDADLLAGICNAQDHHKSVMGSRNILEYLKPLTRLICMPRGRSRKEGTRETPSPQRQELDEEMLLDELRRFVKDSRLNRRRIAQLIGVSSITLQGWIGGTVEPRKAKLLDIKSFLQSHVPDSFRGSGYDTSPEFPFR
jgi:hypothetical protein